MTDLPEGTSELTGCDEILVAADGPVRIVTLNNPDNANAVNNRMHTAFTRLWGALADDPDARAVLITGTGDYFSAGGNLVEWLETHVNNPVTRRAGMRDAVLLKGQQHGEQLVQLAPALGGDDRGGLRPGRL